MPNNSNNNNNKTEGAAGIFKEYGIAEMNIPAAKNTGAAVITVSMSGATSNQIPVIVLSCSGTLQVNYQSQQDFQGNNYITIFGRSVNDFELTCVEAKCGDSKGNSLKTVANYVKNATANGTLVTIEISYESNLSIKGVLVAVGFDFDRPIQKYTLHVIGTQQ